MLSRRPGTGRLWPFVLAGLQVAGIALVLFRAAWIGALLVVIASIGIRPGRFGRTFVVAGIVAAIAFAATSGLEQNKTFATRTKDTTNIYGRLATYEQGLNIFRSAPVFGVGVNRYHAVSQTLPPETVSGVESVTYPHSSYIGLLAEQGLVGFVPLLLLSYAVWRLVRGLRMGSFRHKELVLLTGTVAGAALAYLVMSLTLTMLPYEPSNAFLAVLVGAAAARLDTLSATPSEGDFAG
jgi:O-antigen ligase